MKSYKLPKNFLILIQWAELKQPHCFFQKVVESSLKHQKELDLELILKIESKHRKTVEVIVLCK